MEAGTVLLIVGAVLAACVAAGLSAARAGVPVLVVFLGLGMLLGSDGPGGISFDDASLARTVGTVCLAAILFEGGLSTSLRRLRSVAVPAASLATVGVVVTALLTGVAAHALFDLTWSEAVLLGSVVGSTDAAAVFATLRTTRVRRRLARTLEAEAGVNDPMAVALTIGLIEWVQDPAFRVDDIAALMARQLGLGLVIGAAFGALAMFAFARLPGSFGSFAPVAAVAFGSLAFGAADSAGGSGFLAVYLAGLAIGSTPSRYRGQLVAFHEGLAYLAQVAVFVVLGLLVFPSDLPAVALPGLAVAILLVIVVRPLAVLASLPFLRFNWREQAFLGWAGLRGAVPIVLGTFVLSSPLEGASTIFNAVFFVVLASALVQGTTLEQVARRLGLAEPGGRTAPAPLEVDASSALELVEFVVDHEHAIAGVEVRELGLPRNTLIALIERDHATIPPRGNSVVQAGDRLHILTPKARRPDLQDVISRWRQRI